MPDPSSAKKSSAGRIFDKFVGTMEIGPQEQCKMRIGHASASGLAPKGFSIEYAPDPSPAGSVTAEVTTTGSAKYYDFVLCVSNSGDRTIRADIWQL